VVGRKPPRSLAGMRFAVPSLVALSRLAGFVPSAAAAVLSGTPKVREVKVLRPTGGP
jgi:hypothetical protein